MGEGYVGRKLETIRCFDVVTNETLFRFIEVAGEVLVAPSTCGISAGAAVASEGAAKLNTRDMNVSPGGVGKPTFVVSGRLSFVAAII